MYSCWDDGANVDTDIAEEALTPSFESTNKNAVFASTVTSTTCHSPSLTTPTVCAVAVVRRSRENWRLSRLSVTSTASLCRDHVTFTSHMTVT